MSHKDIPSVPPKDEKPPLDNGPLVETLLEGLATIQAELNKSDGLAKEIRGALEIGAGEAGLPIVQPTEGQQYPDVIFATPSLGHSFCVHYHRSIMETSWLLMQHGITTGVMVRPGDCFVDKARNKLVTDFLREFPGTDNFFFLDDDIGWEPQKVLEFIQRPDDVLAGAYPKKAEFRDFPCSLALNVETGELIESEGLFLAVMAPTGFMRIKRRVLEHLTAQASIFQDITPSGDYESYYYVFESGRGDDGKFWGEDYTFCKKVEAAGFRVWIDPHITFKHQGIRTWEDRLSNHLGTFRKRARAIHAGIDPGNPTDKIDLHEEQKNAIREGWLDKMLDSDHLLTDMKTRARYTDIDQEFWPLYDLCRAHTMTPIERMFDLYKTVEYVAKAGVPGAIAELGVWQGGSMMMAAYALQKFGDHNRKMQLWDTFAGLPSPDPTIDVDSLGAGAEPQWLPGWAEAGLDEVKANMAKTGYANVEFIKGMVEDTISVSALDRYAIVRLDMDWYAGTAAALQVLWDRIVPGGILILDDYGHWLGARKAVDEFFADKPVMMSRVDYSCRTIQKPFDAPFKFREAAE